MKKFYVLILKMATVPPTLSYSHYVEILPLKNIDEIKYYIAIAEKKNLSIRQLRERIKNKEYERLPNETRNKLIDNRNNNNDNKVTELKKNNI